MNERQIQKELKTYFEKYGPAKAVINNIYWFESEADSMVITVANILIECEIKRDLQDFRHDFKKEKHDLMRSLYDTSIIPNFFYFVCPEGLIPTNQIPEYAGLIYIMKLKNSIGYYAKRIITAPILHKEQIPPKQWEKLAMKLYHRL